MIYINVLHYYSVAETIWRNWPLTVWNQYIIILLICFAISKSYKFNNGPTYPVIMIPMVLPIHIPSQRRIASHPWFRSFNTNLFYSYNLVGCLVEMGGGGSKQGVAYKLEKRKLKQCSKKKTELNNVRKRMCVYHWMILFDNFLVEM